MFSRKHQLLTAAVLATLSLTACGKKKSLYTPPTQPTAAETKTTEDSPTLRPSTKKKSDTSKSPSTPRDSRNNPNLPEPDLGGGLSDDSDSRTGQLPEPSTPPPPAPATAENPYGEPARSPRGRSEAPATARPFEPLESNGKNFTGAKAKDGLLYTSSAPDSLIEFLRARNNRVDEAVRRGNIALASSVLSTNLVTRNGEAILTLKLNEDGKSKTYVLAGDIRSGSASKLVLRAGDGTTGSQAADGTLKCVDADGGCENVFARLRIGTPGSASILSVVFRTSGANLFFELPSTHSGNSDYLTLREFMRNTVAKSGDRIVFSQMSSWEVVNGRSGFTVALKGNNGQALSYGGALVAEGENSNAVLSESLESKSRSEFASWITGSQLVSNDTNGRLQLRFSVKSGERFIIKFARQAKPLVDLNDANLR